MDAFLLQPKMATLFWWYLFSQFRTVWYSVNFTSLSWH